MVRKSHDTTTTTHTVTVTDSEAAIAREQRQRAFYSKRDVGIVVGVSFAILIIATLVYWNYAHDLGVKMPKLSSSLDRIVYALKLEILALIPLVAAMFHVMYGRATHRVCRNPLSGHEYVVEKPNRILTNTVEQFLFHVVTVVVYSVLVSHDYTYLIPFVVGCFVIGRIAFHVGYAIHAKHRGYGFVIAFVPTLVVFGYNLYKVLI